MPVAIGAEIRKIVKGRGLTNKAFAQLIDKHEKTVADIYKRTAIDTELLLTISRALNVDLFRYFYEEEPLKTFRENEIRAFMEQIASMKHLLAEKEELIASQSKYVKSQEDVIRLMKEKENFFKTTPPR